MNIDFGDLKDELNNIILYTCIIFNYLIFLNNITHEGYFVGIVILFLLKLLL